MAHVFRHEKLKVYQKALEFVEMRANLLKQISRKVAACDHLDRGAESMLLNIAHSSSAWSSRERIVYLGHANGSSLECAACLDLLVARARLSSNDIRPGKGVLKEIVSMLVAMRTTAADRVCERDSEEYSAERDRFFSHESLKVYQTALRFVEWVEAMSDNFACSADLMAKLDKSSSATVLNIAEGNGRFSATSQASFLKIAYRAAIQSASLIDLATSCKSCAMDRHDQGLDMLRQVAAMLTSLGRSVSKDSYS